MPKPTTDLIVTPTTAAISIPEINRLHETATALAEEARSKANHATQLALVIGLKLTALKAATPHGQWEAQFKGAEKRVGKANVNHGCHLEFTMETARKYIAVAAEIVNRRLTPEQAQALSFITSAAEVTDADRAFLDDVTPPETLRQLYLQMGIVKPTRRELAAMTPLDGADPNPPKPQGKKNLSPTQIVAARKAEARAYFFGTADPDKVDNDSLVMCLLNELNKPITEGRMQHLTHPDLVYLEETLQSLLDRAKKILKA